MKNPKSFWCAEDLFAGPFLSLGDSKLSPKDTSRCLQPHGYPSLVSPLTTFRNFVSEKLLSRKIQLSFRR